MDECKSWVKHLFTPCVDLYEFEASLVYMSSKPAKATWRDPVSKPKPKPQPPSVVNFLKFDNLLPKNQ